MDKLKNKKISRNRGLLEVPIEYGDSCCSKLDHLQYIAYTYANENESYSQMWCMMRQHFSGQISTQPFEAF